MTSHPHTLALLAAHYRGGRHDYRKNAEEGRTVISPRSPPSSMQKFPNRRPCSEDVGVVEHMAKALTLRADSLALSQVLALDKRGTTCNVKSK